MIALALLYFAATGQPVWVQDGPTVDDAWYCQVLLVLAGGVLVRIDNEGAPYLIVIPIREIRAVRERYPAADRRYAESLFQRPDEPGTGRAVRV